MAKLRSFLSVFVSLFVLLFSANAFADTCTAANITNESQQVQKIYTACYNGYRLTNQTCEKCPTNSYINATSFPHTNASCKCIVKEGINSYNYEDTNTAKTTTTTNQCHFCVPIKLQNSSSSSITVYKRYDSNNSTLYTDSKCTQAASIAAPGATNASFTGYYTAQSGGTRCTTAGTTTWTSSCNPAPTTNTITYYAQYKCENGYTVDGTADGATTSAYNQTCQISCLPVTLKYITTASSGTDKTVYVKNGQLDIFTDNQCKKNATVNDLQPTTMAHGTFSVWMLNAGNSINLSNPSELYYINVNSTKLTQPITGPGIELYPAYTCEENYQGSGSAIFDTNGKTICTPSVYTITLKNLNNTVAIIKEVYNTEFQDETGQKITEVTTLSKKNYTFMGYYIGSAAAGGVSSNTLSDRYLKGKKKISNEGYLPDTVAFTEDTTLYAGFVANCTQPSNGTCTRSIDNGAGTVNYTASCKSAGDTLYYAGTSNPVCTSNKICKPIKLKQGFYHYGAPDPIDGTFYVSDVSTALYINDTCTVELEAWTQQGRPDLATKNNAKLDGFLYSYNGGSTLCVTPEREWKCGTPTDGMELSPVYTCNTGYTATGNGTNNYITADQGSCTAKCMKITLDYSKSGVAGGSIVYKKYGDSKLYKEGCQEETTISKPSRSFSSLSGYYTDSTSTESSRCITNEGVWDTDPKYGTECRPTDDMTLYALFNCIDGYQHATYLPTSACQAKCVKITLNSDANGGSGGMPWVYKKYGQWDIFSNSSCTSTLDSITAPTKTNATFKVYSPTNSATGGVQCLSTGGSFNGSNTACNPSADTTFYAVYDCEVGYRRAGTAISGECQANCVQINLDSNGGTGGTPKVYKEYDSTALYSNDTCTSPTSIIAPTHTHGTFFGYASTTVSAGDICYGDGIWQSEDRCNPKTGPKTFFALYQSCSTGYSGYNCAAQSYTCAAGKYLRASDATCQNCPAGKYCEGGTFTYNGSDQGITGNISANHFSTCGAKSSTPGTIDLSCLEGCDCGSCYGALGPNYPNSDEGAKSRAYCYVKLTAGQQVATTGAGATNCTAGRYCTSTDKIYYGPGNNNENKTTYTGEPCHDNLYSTEGASECKACPSTSYVNDTQTGCTTCPAGKQCNGQTAEDCPEGTFSEEGSSTCTPCPDGTYNTGTGNTQCESCPAGKKCIGGHADDCPEGTFSTGGTASCTPCVTGSISGTASSSCTACQNGKTTTGNGQASCNANCSVTATAWKVATWNSTNNSVTNECAADTVTITCIAGKYIPQGQTTCDTTCPAGSFCPGVGSFTISASGATENKCIQTCDKGKYSKDGAAACTQCPAGSIAATTGQDKCTVCPAGTTTTGDDRTSCNKPCDNNSNVASWKTPTWNASNGTATNVCVVDTIYKSCAAGQYIKAGKTTCDTCPSGSYCPGFQNSVIPATGATNDTGINACPNDAKGGTLSSTPGSSEVTHCVTTRLNVAIDHGRATQTCTWTGTKTSGTYDNSCNTNVTACDAGYYHAQPTSPNCISVDTGWYSPNNNLSRFACNELNGADITTVKTDTQTSAAAADCYNTCSNITLYDDNEREIGVRKPISTKVSFNGQTNSDGTTYPSTATFPACTYTTICNAGYDVNGNTCTPKLLTITLQHGNGTPDTNIYLRYRVAWYSDTAQKFGLTAVAIPQTSDGKSFSGYALQNTTEPLYINDKGMLPDPGAFAQNTILVAIYSDKKPITCNKGTYYKGTGTTCTACTAGSWCPGISTYENVGSERGRNACPTANKNLTATWTTDPKTVSVSSATGSDEETDCYATNVTYESSTKNAKGYQTCNYSTATNTYSTCGKNISVEYCNAGYYRKTIDAKDCIEVGYGRYSADGEVINHNCPFLDDTITTETETSDKVTQCYKTGVHLRYDGGHSLHLGNCYHINGESKTAEEGYRHNCPFTEIVACDAGYYDDGKAITNTKRDCAPVTGDYYSPAQTKCVGEPEKPLTAGCSTRRYDCQNPANIENGSATRKKNHVDWNASDYAVCEYDVNCDAGFKPTVTTDPETMAVTVACQPSGPCPVGYYCPDPDTRIKCPCKGTSDGGDKAKEITDCYLLRDPYDYWGHGSGSAKCPWNTTADNEASCKTRDGKEAYNTGCTAIKATSCDAGYYHKEPKSTDCDIITETCLYSPTGETTAIPCPAGCKTTLVSANSNNEKLYTSFEHCYADCLNGIDTSHTLSVTPVKEPVPAISATEWERCAYTVQCETGYEPVSNNTPTASCKAKAFTVTLDKNGGTGSMAASQECTYGAACHLPQITTENLQRGGYTTANKWCTAADGTGNCYAGGTDVTGISANATDITLYAQWTSLILTIQLNDQGATRAAAPNPLYLKYAENWYSDKNGTQRLSALTTLPQKTGYNFGGYKYGSTAVIDANGAFVNNTFAPADATIDAIWSNGKTKCEPGTYFTGNGATCAPCPVGYYCPGGDNFATDSGVEAGKNECPFDGTTDATGKSVVTDCYKNNLATYIVKNNNNKQIGDGTETCYHNGDMSAKIDTDAYNKQCKNRVIKHCVAGYWADVVQNAGKDMPTCYEVGHGFYSEDERLTRSACPTGSDNYGPVTGNIEVSTDGTTSGTVNDCYRTLLETYVANRGTGTQTCYYTSGENEKAEYRTQCKSFAITKCDAGYYWDKQSNAQRTKPDCDPAGIGYYSVQDDMDHTPCPPYNDIVTQQTIKGTTSSTTESNVENCFVSAAEYTAQNGGGYQTCFWLEYTNAYERACDGPTITFCKGGYYFNAAQARFDCVEVGYGFWSPDATLTSSATVKSDSMKRNMCGIGETTQGTTSDSANACYACYANNICEPGKESTPCPDSHPYSDAGNSSINGCYNTDCVLELNAAEMMGRIYYDKTSTCAIKYCAAGYKFNNNKTACIKCGEGEFCPGPNPDCPDCPVEPQSCEDLGGGYWSNSDEGASQPSDCYEKCETHEVKGGTAIKKTERSYYDKRCEYDGIDKKGNPCDIEIVNDEEVCITTACKPSYEMVNGECVPCDRDHALSYLPTGNCVVDSCEIGWHPFTTRCEPDVLECSMPNAARAEARWDKTKNSYSGCIVVECNDGYHITSDNAACVTDIEPCTVEHGVGEREWNHLTRTWGACKATSCDKGYTNDPTESNEPTKQCGNCRNKFGIKGEIAVDEYSSGCTISACMYQGERYALENGECIPICRDESDETGTMTWNAATKKCERKCNPGYVSW